MNDPIYVTKPYLPPLEEYLPLLRRIWDSGVLTNSGPFHQSLEERLCEFLGVPAISLTTNGALGLELAIDVAELKGEVITTPYSFVATVHASKRSGLTPVFVDVKPDDFNIDPAAVERAITPETKAIIAVHCYGNPCDLPALADIAKRHNLWLIYDAAHAFGVRWRGQSVLAWGDMSVLSFHATKSYNTFEGGAVVSSTTELKGEVDRLKNFGIASEVAIPAVGTNAKMSELNAAFGHIQLDHYPRIRDARGAVDRMYRERLADVRGLQVVPVPAEVEPNYSYFPVLVEPEFGIGRDGLYERLKSENIFSRRYFYPLLSNLDMYRNAPSASPSNLPVANRVADHILCLPIYPDLPERDLDRVVEAIRRAS